MTRVWGMGLRSAFLVAWLFWGASALAAQPWVYWDYTARDHQTQFDKFYGLGWRLTSLSTYGNPQDPRYGAVWVQRSGAAWVGFHGVNTAGYQNLFNKWTAQGFHPVILSVAGTAENATFAGTFEKLPGAIPLTRYHLVSGDSASNATVEYWVNWAKSNQQIPRWVSSYGVASNRRYALILVPNKENVSWDLAFDETASEFQFRFNNQTGTSQMARPAFVTVSPDLRFTSLFVDNRLSGGWIARHNMDSVGLKTETDSAISKNLYPLFLIGGGSPSRFAAVYVPNEVSVARQLTVTGKEVAALKPLDNVVTSTMSANNVRSATLAVVRNDRLVYARGYTFAEPGYPTTTPTTMFRIASLSKPLTSIAIHQLLQSNQLHLNDKVQTIVNITQPSGSQPKDSRFAKMEVIDLLTHTCGWGNIYGDFDVASQFGNVLPITKYQRARYHTMWDMPLDPKTKYNYSNFCFGLLGIVLEKLSTPSKTYATLMNERVFQPLGLSRPFVAGTLWKDRKTDEAIYHDNDLRLTPTEWQAGGALIPVQYGGENYSTLS